MHGSMTRVELGQTVQPAAQPSSPVFLVKNINSVTGSDPVGLKDIKGVLYFQANEDWAPRTLWRSDGSEAGTYKVDLGSNDGRRPDPGK